MYQSWRKVYGGSQMSGAGFVVPAAGGGLPSDISGLNLWLKADAEVGYVDNDYITTAVDQSGHGNNTTEAGSGGGADHVRWRTNVINGKPAYQFGVAGNAHYVLPDFCSGFSAGEIFSVGMIAQDPPTTYGWWEFGTSASAIAIPYLDGIIYDDWGSTVRYTTIDPTPPMTSPFVYQVWSANNDWENRLNGGTLFSSGTNTVAFNTAPPLGFSITLGIGVCHMCEVIMYNKKLASGERSIIYNYLEAKYAITLP